jgi:hypothetical protein
MNFDHLLPRLVTVRAYTTVNGKRLYAQAQVERIFWDRMDRDRRQLVWKDVEGRLAQEVMKALDIQHEHD